MTEAGQHDVHHSCVKEALNTAILSKEALLERLERRIESRKGWHKWRSAVLQLSFALIATFTMEGDRVNLTSTQTVLMKSLVTNATQSWLSIQRDRDFYTWHNDVSRTFFVGSQLDALSSRTLSHRCSYQLHFRTPAGWLMGQETSMACQISSNG